MFTRLRTNPPCQTKKTDGDTKEVGTLGWSRSVCCRCGIRRIVWQKTPVAFVDGVIILQPQRCRGDWALRTLNAFYCARTFAVHWSKIWVTWCVSLHLFARKNKSDRDQLNWTKFEFTHKSVTMRKQGRTHLFQIALAGIRPIVRLNQSPWMTLWRLVKTRKGVRSIRNKIISTRSSTCPSKKNVKSVLYIYIFSKWVWRGGGVGQNGPPWTFFRGPLAAWSAGEVGGGAYLTRSGLP